MKRSKFLGALAALAAVPFLSFKNVTIPQKKVTKKEPFIIRHTWLMSKEEQESCHYNLEERAEHQMEQKMFGLIRQNSLITTKRTVDEQGRIMILKTLIIQPM